MEQRPVASQTSLQQQDASELRLFSELQHEVEHVGSFERLMHVAVRQLAPYFGASHAVALAPERGTAGLRIVAQIGARHWEVDEARRVLATGRASLPPEMLYAALHERGKAVAVLLLARPRPFERSELRTLLRAAQVVDRRLEELAEARTVEVLARIDLKISRELRTGDLLYQILDGLELLTRYDHSAAILLFDRERSSLEVSAEKIAWRKMKSPHIHRVLPLDRGVAEILLRENRGFMLGGGAERAVQTSVHALCEVCAADSQLLEAPPARVAGLFDLLSYGKDGSAPAESSMLLVPLLFGRRLLGLLKLSSLHPQAFSRADVFVVGRFIEKVSTAIRNANLYGRRLSELRAINDIGKLVTRSLPFEETCGRILDIVLQVMNLRVGSIEIIDRDASRLRMVAYRGSGEGCRGLPLDEGITGEVARLGRPVLANVVSAHPKYVMHHPEVRSELAVPILFEGVTWGVLNVESYAPARFSDRDLDFLTILADKTATALETLEQREHRRATLDLLHELGGKLIAPEDLQPLLQTTVDLTRKHLCCEVACIFVFENGRFRRRVISGLPEDWLPEESYGSGEGLTGRAAVRGTSPYPHAVVENDVTQSRQANPEMLRRYSERVPSGRIAHLIAVPLLEGDRPVGVLRVINRLTQDGRLAPGGFLDADVTLLTTIASQLSLAIANFEKQERILRMSQHLENQVRERTEEVHRLASFVENAPLAIFEMDRDGVLHFINDAGERMFGYQAAELVARPVTGQGLGLLGDAFQDLLHVVEFMGFWAGEIACRRSDRTTFPVFLSARALRDPGGSVRGVVMFARDITATKELERQLLTMEGKRAMADLAGGVAHDLNNALGAILPTIQNLKADLEEGRIDREQFVQDLQQVENYTRLSVRIFQGMLAMSRGTFAIDKLVNLNERVQTAIDLLSLRLQKAKVDVKLELQPDLPPTLAHPGRLEQVFHNLIANAIDAMPEGGVLTLRTWIEADKIFVEVQDSGTGIPEELLARVQEPFYTSKRHGTGLGLSVVRSIVWEHNGKMVMRSQVGRGTTVHIELPIRGAAEPEQPS